jgi:hypothetical protein
LYVRLAATAVEIPTRSSEEQDARETCAEFWSRNSDCGWIDANVGKNIVAGAVASCK